MRIFYAEDERDILESTTRHLKAEGHSVDTCRRGDDHGLSEMTSTTPSSSTSCCPAWTARDSPPPAQAGHRPVSS